MTPAYCSSIFGAHTSVNVGADLTVLLCDVLAGHIKYQTTVVSARSLTTDVLAHLLR